ncbi:MAG: DNA adenine methylase, partial [Polyangiales bacterium]
ATARVNPQEASAPEASPIQKWVACQSRILSQLTTILPKGVDLMSHFEPFVGGGALFFARRPERALLCDKNPQLCATYEAVRDDVDALIDKLRGLARGHDQERYYQLRHRYNHATKLTTIERAALFIYLNKTCFNGLHRVNRRGEFNVPAGRYTNPRILDEATLRAASRELRRADLRCQSFEALLSLAKPGDFIYFDPPYEPVSRTASFTAYSQDGFTREDQTRLSEVYSELDRRRCKLMLSNSDVPFIRDLYKKFRQEIVAAPRAINCDAKRRGLVSELVILNY